MKLYLTAARTCNLSINGVSLPMKKCQNGGTGMGRQFTAQRHPQQWTKNGRNLEQIPAWDLTEVRSKEQVIDEARTKGTEVHFASLMDINLLNMWMTSNWLERNKTLIRCGKYSIKKLIWENQHLSLRVFTKVVLNDNVKQVQILLTITEPSSNPEFQRVEQKSFHPLKNFVFLHGLMLRRIMQRNVWNEMSWRTRRLNNSAKNQLLALMTIISQKKN